ncbi:multidrug effflux MFS transporter [Chitinophaga lutea]
MTRSTYVSLILILGSLTALGPFTIDMYLPGFPAIAANLHTDEASVGMTLASYFIGLSVGYLVYGPLLDRFGRKRPLFAGLVAYILASAGCVWATTLDMLIALRFVQALGACAASVTAVAMVRDLFPVKENAKVFALLMLVVAVSPLVAPLLGSYFTVAFGWQSVFMVLCGMGIAVLAAGIRWLPDSYKPDTTLSLKPGPVIANFLSVGRVPQFYTYTVAGATAFAALFAYISAAPKLFLTVYHMPASQFSWLFALLATGFIGSSQLNTLLLRKFSSAKIVPVALAGQALTGIFFVTAAVNGWLGLLGTIVTLFIYLSFLGIANPNNAALAMAPFERNGGTASSLMGACQMAFGATASLVVSLYKADSIVPLAAVMAVVAVLALIILLIGRRRI